MYWWAPPFVLLQCNCDLLNHTTWSNGNGLYIPHGMVAAILFLVDQVMCDWLNHTSWFHSNPALPQSMEFESILLYSFLYNTVTNMLCRLFDDCKYMDIYLPIPQEYCYFGKQKNCFLVSTCQQLWPSPSHLVNLSNWLIGDIFTGFVQRFCAVFFKVY